MNESTAREIQISHMTEHLSERMRRLCCEVLHRLPPGWDEYRTFSFTESDDRPMRDGAFICAGARREETGESFLSELPSGVEPEQCWEVILYVEQLRALSDPAVRWVIAHELAHVASGLRTGSILIEGTAMTETSPGRYEPAPSTSDHEDAADRLAMEWGFTAELLQCLADQQ